MEKKKLSELIKELNVESKEVISVLKKAGFPQKNSKSNLDEKELDCIFEYYTTLYMVESIESMLEEASAKKAEPETKEEEPKKKKTAASASKKDEKPKGKEKPKSVSVGMSDDEALKKVLETPIERKMRHIDTRSSNVTENKIDDEKIEKILTTDDIYGSQDRKQKIKKNNGQRQQQSKKFEKTDLKKKKGEKPKPEILHIKIPDEITVGDLAVKMKKTAAEVIKKLFAYGVMATVNEVIDYDTAALIAEEFNIKYEREIVISLEDQLIYNEEEKEEDMKPRSPVVVVMGHVDHGKTSLLDAIRNTDVISTEAGGITQHIGAYRVKIDGKDITFLDTPGHEAFTAMRARGAQVTDIAILVVAADDGIMPQTVEAINHAKAAGVSIIVAINKMDKEGANPEKIKQSLTEYDLVPEEWGGDVICVPISAKNHDNIDKLLEMVLLVAEVKDLKANPDRAAEGTVIEAKLDKGRGPVATVLVQKGTLHVGDYIIAGMTSGKIRAMINDKGVSIKQAGPSIPVEVVGLNEVPTGGDTFNAVKDERKAKQLIEMRKFDKKEETFKAQQKVTLENLFEHINEGQMKELDVIVKADVQGSVEAVSQALSKLSNEEVRVKVIHGGVGAISESDVMLANASNAIIVGFNVRPDAGAAASAESEGVDIRLYRVIYQAIEEMEAAMKGMLAPKYVEVVLGHAEVRDTFRITGVGTIAGSYVTDGKIKRNSEVRVVRDGIVIFEGALSSLKRFKDDAKEVAEGYECGIGIEKYNDLKIGDVIECFSEEEVE